MTTSTRPFCAGFLIHQTSPDEVVTPEDLGEEGRPALDAKIQTLSEFSAECAMTKVQTSEAKSGGLPGPS